MKKPTGDPGKKKRRASPAGDAFDPAEVLHHSPSAVVVLDPDLRVVYLNERAERYMSERGVGAALARDIFEIDPSLAGTAFETALLASLRGRAPVRLERFENPGTRRVFSVWIIPLVEGVVVHFRDVTHLSTREKQQAAVASFGVQALLARESDNEAFLADAMTAVRDALGVELCGFFAMPAEHDNATLIAGTGWSDNMVGVFSEEPGGGSHVALTIRAGEPVAFGSMTETQQSAFADHAVLRAHGVQSGLSALAHTADGLHGVLVAYSTRERDFSSDDLNFLQAIANGVAGVRQRWLAAAALSQSEQKLRHAQKMEAVGRLAGGVAHDFNNLLTLIHSYSEMVIADLEGQDAIRSDVLEIKRASQKAAALTRQLLAFSRRQVLRPRELNLNEVIDGLQKMLLRVIGEDVRLEVDLSSAVAPVLADPGQMEQAIMNLVLNSRDAMPGGGRLTISSANATVDSRMHSRWHDAVPGDYVEVVVADTGLGISPDVLTHVFEPFFTTKERGTNTGLGLSTVYGIVSQSGGFVLAESEEGKGTTVRILLPVHKSEAEVVVARTAPSPERRLTRTILLVEDEPAVRQVARRVLEGRGYIVLEAPNGEEALAVFATEGPTIDLIVTDIVMPRMNGRSFVRKLREGTHVPRVLFMSGYTEDEIVRQDLLPAGTTFMEKPFSVQSLLGAVKRALE